MKILNMIPLLLLASSCAHIRTDFKYLPTQKYLKKQIPPGTNMIVADPSVPFDHPLYCFVDIAAWGNSNASPPLLTEALKKEAIKHNVEVLFIAGMTQDVAGHMGQHLGYGITINNPIYRHEMTARGCIISEVVLGINQNQNSGIIEYVWKNSPAEKAGIKEGMKILAINSRPILGDPNAMVIEISSKSKGDKILIEYLDLEGKKKSKEVILEGRSPASDANIANLKAVAKKENPVSQDIKKNCRIDAASSLKVCE